MVQHRQQDSSACQGGSIKLTEMGRWIASGAAQKETFLLILGLKAALGKDTRLSVLFFFLFELNLASIYYLILPLVLTFFFGDCGCQVLPPLLPSLGQNVTQVSMGRKEKIKYKEPNKRTKNKQTKKKTTTTTNNKYIDDERLFEKLSVPTNGENWGRRKAKREVSLLKSGCNCIVSVCLYIRHILALCLKK